jgi:hypothetical protein
LECTPGERGTAEWGVVKVVDAPNAESNGCFKASVLDCVVSGDVVESGGGGSHNGKRWLLRRGAMTWCVAATYRFDSLLPEKYVLKTYFL